MHILVPPTGWLWPLLLGIVAWNLLTLQHQAQAFSRMRDSLEVLIQRGTTAWIAPPIDSTRKGDTVRLRRKR